MTGEALAVLAALAYGLAGVSIVRGKSTARGDNGVFLSVVVTALLSLGLWIGWGTTRVAALGSQAGVTSLAIFILAGLLSNVLGRQSMYRATEQIGAVRAGVLRRLTPLFALPCAYVMLGEQPGLATYLGGGLVLFGVMAYMRSPANMASVPMAGLLLGVFSALAYAIAYTLRSVGLELTPDAALGTCIGAIIGAAWLFTMAAIQKGARNGWRFVTVDRSARHWCSALALSAGQLLQFFALKNATVVSVAVLGTLEVLFTALFVLLITRSEAIAVGRLVIAFLLAILGTGLLFLE